MLRCFTVVSQSCSLTSYVVSLTCWVKEQGIYACIALFRVIAERTRYIHTQRSLRLLSKTNIRRYVSERVVNDTTHR